MSEIWVGKNADIGAQITVPRVRGDKVLWVDSLSIQQSSMHACQGMLDAIDRLVFSQLQSRVTRLKNLKDRTDPMLAIYPGGGSRFQKHVDNTAQDGRRLTVLCYLNPDWSESDGGSLRVHEPHAHNVVDVQPSCGRLALFFADEMPHEVMPANSMRHAMTVWYYDKTEREDAVARAKETAPKEETSEHIKARQEARAFLLWILAHEGEVNQESVNAIVQRSKKMRPHALKIVAGVTGAPSTEEFMEGLARLTPMSLQKLRTDLNDMGIDHAYK
uniref:Fe2OG dioxygenase domain-containing protein n=1 Tax=Octactis speculum TaxID=3111310 RepID=A0A7S2B3K6_9STRA|mmetsp:Transcript_18556/g.25181  ORF Transcript_18556/g.25181 Transcript_18556/m.25181 type:complete len:274 (+) Transcript_18556:373-1194(+)